MDASQPYPLLKSAIKQGDTNRLRYLTDRFPELLIMKVPAFGTWLHYAAAHGTLDVVKQLVELGLDVNTLEDDEGERPLVDAAAKNKPDVAQYLLDNGAVMDVSASIRNPLFAAIIGGSPEIARLLLERGIDSKVRYNSPTMKNMDAVAFAMMEGQHEIAHLIALWNANGDEIAARRAMEEGLRIARENTIPVDPDEQFADS